MSWRFITWLGKYLLMPTKCLNKPVTKNTSNKHWCNLSDIYYVPLQGRERTMWETVWQTTVMLLCLTVWQCEAFIRLKSSATGLSESHSNQNESWKISRLRCKTLNVVISIRSASSNLADKTVNVSTDGG